MVVYNQKTERVLGLDVSEVVGLAPLEQFVAARGMHDQQLEVTCIGLTNRCRGDLHEMSQGRINLDEVEAQMQTHADDRIGVPWSFLAHGQDRTADLCLPQAGHGDADRPTCHLSVAEQAGCDHVLHDLRALAGQIPQKKVLLRQGPGGVDDQLLGDVLVDAVGSVRVRAKVVHLARIDVTHAHCDDLPVAHQAEHAADSMRLATYVRAGSIDRIDREPDVERGVRARNVQAFLTNDPELREPLAKKLLDDGLGLYVCVRDPVRSSASLRTLGACLVLEAHDVGRDHCATHSFLHQAANGMRVELAVYTCIVHGLPPLVLSGQID